jgi:hypothetical protein
VKIIWAEDSFILGEAPDRDYWLAKEHAGFKFHSATATWRGDVEALEKLRRVKDKISAGLTINQGALDVYLEYQNSRTLTASRATDADIDIPAPAGLEYLPYQKAGIAFALRVFGDLK